ncbi:MAG: 4Fe-4S binding protein [Clostridia bacterium]|nr:4Fe-4S binding protein [Clostridia bacterium]
MGRLLGKKGKAILLLLLYALPIFAGFNSADAIQPGMHHGPADKEMDSITHPAGILNTEKAATFLVGGIFLIGIAAIVFVAWRLGKQKYPLDRKSFSYDLLSFKPLARLIRLKYLRLSLQIVHIAALLVIVYLGFYSVQNHNENIAYTFSWYIWWPLFFISILLLGRIWCMICPFAAIGDLAQKLVNFKKAYPLEMRDLWIALSLFLILHFIYIWHIVGSPFITATVVLWGMVIPAVIVSIIFQRRNFCQYICPLGAFLSVYSQVAPIKIANKSEQVCRDCRTKECFEGNQYGQGCPVSLTVPIIKRAGDCLLCMECVKTCQKNNVALNLRPFGHDLWNSLRRTFDEATIGIVMVGLVVTKTAIMLDAFNQVVEWLAKKLDFTISLATNMLFVGMTFALPFGFTFLALWLILKLQQDGQAGFWDMYKVLGYMLLPIALTLQIAHELEHFLRDGPLLVGAVSSLFSFSPSMPVFQGLGEMITTYSVSPDLLFVMQVLIIIGGFLLTLYAGYRMAITLYDQPKAVKGVLIPMYSLAVIFTMISVYMMGLSMGGH